jgi:hypothetical protein
VIGTSWGDWQRDVQVIGTSCSSQQRNRPSFLAEEHSRLDSTKVLVADEFVVWVRLVWVRMIGTSWGDW